MRREFDFGINKLRPITGAAAALVAGSVGFHPGNADAAFILTLDSAATGIVDVIIMDGAAAGAATVLGPTTAADLVADGILTFVGGLAGSPFIVNVTTGFSKPALAPAEMDLNSVNVNSGGADTLTIRLTDTDFDGTVHKLIAQLGGVLSAPAGSTIAFEGIVDADNVAFGAGEAVSVGPFGPGAFAALATEGFAPIAGPFSMTQVVTIVMTGAGSISFDFDLRAAPEPASLALFGLGLLGLGLMRRRRTA